ncbi:MAG: hypothetical protein J3Q66DRAFT_352708 [Benniella sp.]|nr:MAG: hypothetical protein J3Q66DRAFT_352708 [Benniella sp.]
MNNLSASPLNLPEVRDMVGKHLDRSDLARCLCVCRSWHASFVPLVWSTASILPEPTHLNPSLEAFIRHCHHLKELSYTVDAPREYRSTPCPKLSDLQVSVTQPPANPPPNDTVVIDIPQHEQLRTLRIKGAEMGPSLRIIWKPAHHLHNLSGLSLSNLEIEPQDTTTFWDLCTQLEVLQTANVSVELPVQSITFDRLMCLGLNLSLKPRNSLERQLDFIIQCPNLTLLHWINLDGELASRYTGRFKPGTCAWPNLREFSLIGPGFSDEQLAQIIGAMRDLKTLEIIGCEVGLSFLAALRPHFPSLRSLDISDANALTPTITSHILASCSDLESLVVGHCMSQDIIDGPPWICENSLKELTAAFMFPLGDAAVHHQRQVLQRISRLTNLKKVTLSQAYDIDACYLDLRLENGLELLATWKNLEKLSFYAGFHHVSARDVEWMIDNWKNLKEVDGYFNQRNRDELIAMFRAAGVKCRIF